jgi:hypothetical protein
MRTYFTIFLLLVIIESFGQVTNVKTGLWSDATVWSNNKVPVDTTRIILNFDIQVDVSATCRALNTNGHQVTVNQAINFFISGFAAPVANFSYSGSSTVPTTISFTNGSSNATSYLWDFGDPASGANNTSTAVNPTHFYQTLAPYLTSTIVKLKTIGPGGADSISKYIGLNCVPQVIEVGSTIDVPTTWDQCHIYHCSKYVAINAPLTIEGATVTFDLQKGMIVQGNGKLISRNAVFTSSAPQKKYGDWANISFGTTSGNSITGGAIQYAGYATLNHERALNVGSGANNTVSKVIFEYNSGTLNQLFATLDMSIAPKSSVANNNIFFSNHGHPVLIGIATDFDSTNEFSFNQCNAIFVDAVHIDQSFGMTWTNKQAPYVLGGWSGNSWSFDAGKILTLGNGVVLKFARYTNPGFTLFLPSGLSQIQNYDGPGVVFTSYDDDSVMGDSNGDGPPVTISAWEGIQTAGPVWYHLPNMFYNAH